MKKRDPTPRVNRHVGANTRKKGHNDTDMSHKCTDDLIDTCATDSSTLKRRIHYFTENKGNRSDIALQHRIASSHARDPGAFTP